MAETTVTDKLVACLNDAHVTEHAEIAAHRLLERVAEPAGDAQAADAARANRAEEEEEQMARFLDGRRDTDRADPAPER